MNLWHIRFKIDVALEYLTALNEWIFSEYLEWEKKRKKTKNKNEIENLEIEFEVLEFLSEDTKKKSKLLLKHIEIFKKLELFYRKN